MKFENNFCYDGFYFKNTSEENRADIIEYASDVEVTKYLTFPTYKSSEDADYFFNEHLPNILEKPNGTSFAIYNTQDECIGLIDASASSLEENICEIGYVLKRKYWQQGYMSKVLPKMIEICFNELGNKKIIIKHHIDNIGSQKVIERAGFNFVELGKFDYANTGEQQTTKCYEMINKAY